MFINQVLYQLRLRFGFFFRVQFCASLLQVFSRDARHRRHTITRLRLDKMHAFRGTTSLLDRFVLDTDRNTVRSDDRQVVILLYDTCRNDLLGVDGRPLRYVIEGRIMDLELPNRYIVGTWRSQNGPRAMRPVENRRQPCAAFLYTVDG